MAKKLNFSRIKTYPIKKRKNKTSVKNFVKVCNPNPSMNEFIDSLPDIFVGRNFREFVSKIVKAYKNKKPIIFMMGAHVIKCGLSPLIINLMKDKIVSAVALNGAGAIHDFEIAMIGATSEDVAINIEDGSFGMAHETGFHMNRALKNGVPKGWGAGKIFGEKIIKEKFSYKDYSVLHAGIKYNVPVTIHIAIGTDIIHQHPNVSGKDLGESSYRDFQTFASNVAELEGGVIINFGSAVILPEVFLKSITVARNLGFCVKNFTSANFDMIRHYRPEQNVLSRPTSCGGSSFYFSGNHEIMIPLLINAVYSEINKM